MSPTVIWAILGLGLMVAELLTMTFVLIFFGVAALLVSLAKYFGLNHLVFEIVLFSVIGLSGIFIFRKKLLANCTPKEKMSLDHRKPIVLSADIPMGGEARISYQGTQWSAHNESGRDLKIGDKVVIARTDGIDLYVNLPENLKEEL